MVSEYGPEHTSVAGTADLGHHVPPRPGRHHRLVHTTVRLAHTLAAMIGAAPDFELLAPVSTSIVAFGTAPPTGTTGSMSSTARSPPPSSTADAPSYRHPAGRGRALRACLLNPATTEDDLSGWARTEIRAAATSLPRYCAR